MRERITSRQNPLIRQVRRLQTSRSFRRKEGLYLCDGVKLLEEAVKWGAQVETLILTEGMQVREPMGARVVEVPEDIMTFISPMETPQGALFLCRLPELTMPARLDGKRYLVLDGLQDPGNVGTIWRTADAFGADALLLTGGCADPYNHKAVRASMGAVFRLPVYEADEDTLCALCREAGLPLYATALREDTVTLGEFDLGRCAVVIGSEGSGVSRRMLDQCEKTILIPMESTCESLNAATAAAVVLWEMYRGSNRN